MFCFARPNNTIQWLTFISSFLPDSFVVISVSLHISSPEMFCTVKYFIPRPSSVNKEKLTELLWDFSRSDLLEPEDEDPGDDDTEDVDQGEGETDQSQQEGLQREVL